MPIKALPIHYLDAENRRKTLKNKKYNFHITNLGFAVSGICRIFASGIGQERGDDSAKDRMTQADGFGDQVVQKREQVA